MSSPNVASHNTLSGLGYNSALALGLDLARDPKEGLSSLGLPGLGPYKPPLMPSHDPHAFSALSGLKQGYPVGSPLSPYVGYARVKTAAGASTLVPVCRDPFCTNCQFSVQTAQLQPPCPSGCTQCTHDRLQLPSSLSLSPLQGSCSPSSLYSPHALQLPRANVCSWMVGDTYCGKRFGTSEELLQHLRSHTNLSGADTLSLLSPVSTLPSACHLHYSTAASSLSAGLRRTAYPSSLSPVSSLGARYHPYKPSLPGLLPGAPLAPLPHPGLGMYYSPYGMYGQRLGPPVHP